MAIRNMGVTFNTVVTTCTIATVLSGFELIQVNNHITAKPVTIA